ncbi:hypothetical protein MKW94_021466 [Papaver nudicaule]|uniref:TF-B3 domain-containing protein n=1 Tax=Papaver nudicaule TaxID=74823 RepID=A0AA41W3F6_PAPNU|nr:hypothetical protein [Papaver nudicaule]
MHFLDIIHTSIIRDKRLVLPNEFTKKYGKELSDHAIITIPNGIWHIGISKGEGELVFEKGWPEFMEFYSVCVGHLILFRYDGNSIFHVNIFDIDSTEIDYYPSHMDNTKHEVELVSSYSDEVEVVLPSKNRKVEVISLPSNNTQSIYEPSMSSVSTTQSIYEPSMSTRHEFSQNKRKQRAFIPLRFHTKEFRATVEAAEAFKPENPFFKLIIQASHIKRGVTVPAVFAAAHLTSITQIMITVRVSDGRSWEVKYIFRAPTERRLSQGWNKFAADNDLKEGDVCVFELIDREKIELNVHIFRQHKTFARKVTPRIRNYTAKFMATLVATEEFTSENPFFTVIMQPSNVDRQLLRVPTVFATTHFTNITQIVITLKVSDGRTWEVGYVFRAPKGRWLTQGWRKFAADNDLKEGDFCVFELVDRKKFEFVVHIFEQQEPSARKIAPKSSYYTTEFQETLDAAEEFTSENPFFKVVMHAAQIKGGFVRVPASFSPLANITRMVINLRVSDEETWDVGYISRTPIERRISHGWREFVSDNDLKEGDVCVFELVDHKKKFEMKVHIFRLLQDIV